MRCGQCSFGQSRVGPCSCPSWVSLYGPAAKGSAEGRRAAGCLGWLAALQPPCLAFGSVSPTARLLALRFQRKGNGIGAAVALRLFGAPK